MTRLEMAGVVLTCEHGRWFVDGEPQNDVDIALSLFLARCYPSSQELPVALRRYIRRFAGNQLCAPSVMVRRARGDMTQAALAKASGVAQSNISRIESGSQDPKASTLFNITHAAHR